MMQLKKIFQNSILVSMVLFAISCETLFEPVYENLYEESRILRDAPFAEGVLLQAYTGLPASYNMDETATDDAVSNQVGNSFSRMATGEWSSQFTPVSIWESSYTQLFYLNYFLSLVGDVLWSWESPVRNEHFRKRFTGEAHALRAWYNFELLRKHGGLSADGTALGFVIIKPEFTADLSNETLLNLPRSSYEECVQFILADIDKAVSLLPDEYLNSGDIDYNLVFGAQNRNRISGKAVRALRARVLLHAASQSFYNAPNKWAAAADAAASVISAIGGVSGISPTGHQWYLNFNNPEIIWRRDHATILTWEEANFPPTLFGNGRTNPSQNLVDAFPMANGYPIAHTESNYNEGNPYVGRDPRLAAYILYNGNNIGTRTIFTHTGSLDGLNMSQNSTRTGYYLKKLLRGDVNLNPATRVPQAHFYTFFRYTEMFLIYAEAANEAWGPNSDPKGHGYTAADVIRAIRNRAGIPQPDQYLVAVSASKETMRDLVRNERRIELCFEGFRFWDLRRWNMNLNETAKGVSITNGTPTIINVENRSFQPHMVHGPIPYREVLKFRNVSQNAGW
jgi:starch-binding outer membrane protein, SusD/RagB family